MDPRKDCHVLSTIVENPGILLVCVSTNVLPASRFSTTDKASPILPLVPFDSPLRRPVKPRPPRPPPTAPSAVEASSSPVLMQRQLPPFAASCSAISNANPITAPMHHGQLPVGSDSEIGSPSVYA